MGNGIGKKNLEVEELRSEVSSKSFFEFCDDIRNANSMAGKFLDEKEMQLMFFLSESDKIKNAGDVPLFWRSLCRVGVSKMDHNVVHAGMGMGEKGEIEQTSSDIPLHGNGEIVSTTSDKKGNISTNDALSMNTAGAFNGPSSISGERPVDLFNQSIDAASMLYGEITEKSEVRLMTVKQFYALFLRLLSDYLRFRNDRKEDITQSNFLSQSAAELLCESTDSECVICMERVTNVTLPCLHSYCEKCIDEWKLKSDECPMCRQSSKLSDQWLVEEAPSSSEVASFLHAYVKSISIEK